MGTNWIMPMFAAGACSAGAIVLLRDLPRVAPGMPVLVTVGIYMLLGGAILLLAAGATYWTGAAGTDRIVWPSPQGAFQIAAIGLLLGALEAFFVLGGQRAMPLPDAMVVYNLTSLALVTAAGILMFREPITLQKIVGLGMGLASVLLLLGQTTTEKAA